MSYAAHFELADRLGMHLHDLMGWPGPMTHRQFEAWQRWLVEQLNRPSRSDFYAMQVAYEARNILRSLGGGGRALSMEDFRLQFNTGGHTRRHSSPAEMKSIILGSLGVAPVDSPSQKSAVEE